MRGTHGGSEAQASIAMRFNTVQLVRPYSIDASDHPGRIPLAPGAISVAHDEIISLRMMHLLREAVGVEGRGWRHPDVRDAATGCRRC